MMRRWPIDGPVVLEGPKFEIAEGRWSASI
jgi:hypothetical protein